VAVVSWTRDFTLTSALGDLTIPAGLLIPGESAIGINVRNADYSAPAQPGTIIGPRFKDGYQAHLVLNMQNDAGSIAVDADLQDLYDTLMGHLEAMFETNGRLQWAVAGGGDDRMLDRVRTLEMPGASGGLPKKFEFTLQCPRPHAMDAPEQTTELSDSTPVTISRDGSAQEFKPVAHVLGPVDTFQLKNTTLGLMVSYDSSLPGASSIASGHFAEIDFLAETVTLDGDVGFLEEGVVWDETDFWGLVKGDNVIELDGAGGELLWNVPWA
jgi:hypothetical protein